MNTYYECRVKYEKLHEHTGKAIKVNAPYLIDAVSYTEAETRIHKEMEERVSGSFVVKNIKSANYTDLFFYDDGNWWYKCKVTFVTIDEEAGREKKVANQMLVMADDVKQAHERIDESMQGMTVDYEIEAVAKSNIQDVFAYDLEEAAEELDSKANAYKN